MEIILRGDGLIIFGLKLITFLDVGYSKRSNNYCTNKYGDYHTLKLAATACHRDDECQAINDHECDHNGQFQLCSTASSSIKSSDKGSCVYVKDVLS